MEPIDLASLREAAGVSLEAFAARCEVEPAQVLAWEASPGTAPADIVLSHYLPPEAEARDLVPRQLTVPSLSGAHVVEPSAAQLSRILAPLREVDSEELAPHVEAMTALMERPWVALGGGFDSGKTSLMNLLLEGAFVSKTGLTPETRDLWIVRHTDRLPGWSEATALVFDATFDPHDYWDETAARPHLRHQGSAAAIDTELDALGLHGSQLHVFVDAALLRYCTIVDPPGHGHTSEDDNLGWPAYASPEVEALVFLDQAAHFAASEATIEKLGSRLQRVTAARLKANRFPPSLYVLAARPDPSHALCIEELEAQLAARLEEALNSSAHLTQSPPAFKLYVWNNPAQKLKGSPAGTTRPHGQRFLDEFVRDVVDRHAQDARRWSETTISDLTTALGELGSSREREIALVARARESLQDDDAYQRALTSFYAVWRERAKANSKQVSGQIRAADHNFHESRRAFTVKLKAAGNPHEWAVNDSMYWYDKRLRREAAGVVQSAYEAFIKRHRRRFISLLKGFAPEGSNAQDLADRLGGGAHGTHLKFDDFSRRLAAGAAHDTVHAVPQRPNMWSRFWSDGDRDWCVQVHRAVRARARRKLIPVVRHDAETVYLDALNRPSDAVSNLKRTFERWRSRELESLKQRADDLRIQLEALRRATMASSALASTSLCGTRDQPSSKRQRRMC